MKRRRSRSSPFLLIEERMATPTNTSKALWKTTEIMGGFPIFDNYEDGNMWRVESGREAEGISHGETAASSDATAP